jgi:hypothetical protein
VDRPLIELFSLYPSTPLPEPASSSMKGSIPLRAMQYCGPLTSASGFGFYLYSPVDFALRWDGDFSEFSLLEDNEPVKWQSMTGNVSQQIPDAAEVWTSMSPERRAQLLDAGEDELSLINFDPRDPNTFEMHIGIVARTPPGWSILSRGVPNLRPIPGLRVLDGVLETSWFRGNIPVTGRLTDVGRIVRIHRNYPLACIQPIPDLAFDPETMNSATVAQGMDNVPADVWDEMLANFRRRNHERVLGSYKRESREYAARCPVAD